MRIGVAVFAFCLILAQPVMGQATSSAITNSDVISMTKAGIGEQTIILAIQHGPVKFDTSPLALIALKQAGLPDRVLNAILSVPKPPNPAPLASQTQAVSQPANQQANPQGNAQPPIPNEKGPSYCASRAGETIAASTARTNCCERRSGIACSNLAHFYETGSEGLPTDLSIAHELKEKACEQEEWGDCSVRIGDPSEKIAFDRAMAMTDPAAKEATLVTFLQVYPQTNASSAVYGTLAEIREQAAKNAPPPPSPPPVAIQRLPQAGTQGFTLRVLQEQSIPYTRESGGGISTACNIFGTANTSAYVSGYGNSAYGNATTDINQHMQCNSYDTTIRWPHIFNVMFAQGSDGISYIIACDKAWRWSKCSPLRAGDVFSARITEKGIEVQATSSKGKEENLTYNILQSKAWR